jgi:hypothetical protein
MIQRSTLLLATAIASLALAAATPARAHSPKSGKHTDSICVAGCRDTARGCRADARGAAELCAASTCSTKLQEAKDACSSAPESEACATARDAAEQCLAPCLAEFKKAIGTCRDDQKGCVTGCPNAAPPQETDPQCVATCRTTLQSCSGTARDAAGACLDQCKGLVAAAQTVCAQGHKGKDCRTAWQAAQTCLQPCGDTLRGALHTCIEVAGGCIGACQNGSQP